MSPPPESKLGALVPSCYRSTTIRKRMREFLGGSRTKSLTCRYITADDDSASRRIPRPATSLDGALDRGCDIGRSLWDEEALLADLDIEYVNFDAPAEVYQNPSVGFILQEPVVHRVERLLTQCGIEFLHCLSGRGHHFTWRIPFGSAAFRQLEELGAGMTPTFRGMNSSPQREDGISTSQSQAFLGLGLVMEYLAGETRRQVGHLCAVPVELTAVEAGSIGFGREVVSIDVSEYGDPLPSRTMRVPFSVYLKPRQLQLGGEDQRPIFVIPVKDLPLEAALQIMRDPVLVQRWARHVSTVIPTAAEGTENLVTQYRASALHAFHRWYFSHHPHGPAEWPHTYDRLSLDVLPPCARHVLERPNDALLRPWGMRLVTRVLLALGWHPRHVAGVIWSKFARDHGWGDVWQGYDPAMRADFYTRIFAGPFVNRTDDLLDFNCQSSKEERPCPTEWCSWNLASFRQSALARRRYGRLAHAPFNDVFSPVEHL